MTISHDPGLHLTRTGQALANCLAKCCFLAGFGCLAIEAIPAGLLACGLWLLALALLRWVEHSRRHTQPGARQ